MEYSFEDSQVQDRYNTAYDYITDADYEDKIDLLDRYVWDFIDKGMASTAMLLVQEVKQFIKDSK